MMDKVELCRAKQYKTRQRYPCTSESITSGQSGDCPVYSRDLYIHGDCALTMVCA